MSVTLDPHPSSIDEHVIAAPLSRKSELTEHDPYWIKNHRQAFQRDLPFVCDVPPGEGEEGPEGIKGLYKIKSTSKQPVPPIRLFCMVYTHSNQHHIIQSIIETYAPSCDGFLAVSNLTDKTLGVFAVPHNGSEAYSNMWNKVQAMWTFVHDHYLELYDWFHIGGDDMFLIPDNIKRAAAQVENKSQPQILGGSIPLHKPRRSFCGGGAGYTLNPAAVRALVEGFQHRCPSEMGRSEEDVLVSRCLEGIGILCQDTNDARGEVRYHALDIQYHTSWNRNKTSLINWKALEKYHGIAAGQEGLAQISDTSVSFHLDKAVVRSRSADRGIRRYHAILEDECGPSFSEAVAKAASLDNQEERKRLERKWKENPLVREMLKGQGALGFQVLQKK